ncbi:hypothetical protein C8J47_0399 [Sphingomonas sp. PP-F2F-G114-C0414]|nr:hypothetical protein C8J47_0399 [Sphingomonas sp. PP-F2F-G114-C0414]
MPPPDTLFPRLRGGTRRGSAATKTIPHYSHPGEGRGPSGKVVVTERHPPLATFPSWAPASAGVVSWEWLGFV